MEFSLIPEGIDIFPQLRDNFPAIAGRLQLLWNVSKTSMGAAQPLPRVYLDIIQEMEAPPHLLTPCCALVATSPRWDPHPIAVYSVHLPLGPAVHKFYSHAL